MKVYMLEGTYKHDDTLHPYIINIYETKEKAEVASKDYENSFAFVEVTEWEVQ